ncbi:MAG TPA: four helix bundle protein, partial [Kofleriaceae bacterium]|nr:four helix bundle protein [Kofleriaceae bacterium]
MLADDLVTDVYRVTRAFPADERFGLTSQVRRAAVSVACNLVEGASRSSPRDYQRFVVVALGSANEARYLLGLAQRLALLSETESSPLVERYGHVVRALWGLATALS